MGGDIKVSVEFDMFVKFDSVLVEFDEINEARRRFALLSGNVGYFDCGGRI